MVDILGNSSRMLRSSSREFVGQNKVFLSGSGEAPFQQFYKAKEK